MSDTEFSEQGEFAQPRPTKLRIANWLQEMIKGPEAAQPEPYRTELGLPLLPGGKRPGAEMAMDDGGAFPFQSYLGMGGQGAFNLFFPGYPYLAELQQRSEYRQPAETTAKEMVRKWIQFKSNSGGKDASKKIKEIEERFEELDIQGLFKKALEHDAFFGLAHIFIDIKGQDGEDRANPLLIDKKTIAKGSLKGFRTIEPMWVTPIQWNATDPTAEDFYKPTAWFALNQRVHHTRLIQIVSRPLPDLLKPAYNFGGISLSQLIRPYVDRWLRTVDGVNRLINNFSIVYLQTDMSAMMQGEDGGGWTTEDQASLIARLRMFTRERDNQGIFVTDKNNEMLSALSVPLGGLEALQAQSQEHMAAPTHLPLVVLTGITPAGLNASSESELEVFHDWIHSNQELVVRRPLLDVLKIVQLDLFGEIDDSIGFEFVPLKQLDGEAASRVYKTKSEAGTAYIDAGVISAEEERQRLARDPDSGYINLDPDKLPEPPQEGPEGEGGPGGGEEQEGEEPEGKEDEGGEKPKGAGAAHERLKKSDSDEDDGGEDEMPAWDSGAWDEEWEESKHPRAANGQFGSGGGGASQSKGGGSSKGSNLPGGVEKLEANRPNPGVAEEVAQVNAKASIGAERRLKDYIERIGGPDAARARAQTEVGRKFASSAAETLVYGVDIKEGTTAPVSVKEVSPEVGRGLFADAPIKKSGFIGEYIGDVKRLDPENMGDYAFWFPPRTGLEDYVIDASKAGNELRFANHSSDPNMDIRCVNSEGEWHVIFTAKRDISPGEQLTFDYGPAYWEKRKAPQELGGSGNDSAPKSRIPSQMAKAAAAGTSRASRKALDAILGTGAKWEEHKHPRAANGRFGKGSGGAPAKAKAKAPKKEKAPNRSLTDALAMLGGKELKSSDGEYHRVILRGFQTTRQLYGLEEKQNGKGPPFATVDGKRISDKSRRALQGLLGAIEVKYDPVNDKWTTNLDDITGWKPKAGDKKIAEKLIERAKSAGEEARRAPKTKSERKGIARPKTDLGHEQSVMDMALRASTGAPGMYKAHDILKSIIKATDEDGYFNKLSKELLKKVPNVDVKRESGLVEYKRYDGTEGKAAGLCSLRGGNALSIRVAGNATSQTVVHEIVHAATMKFLFDHPLHPETKKLDAIVAHVQGEARRLGVTWDPDKRTGHYGTLNRDEFLAESMSNPDFQKFLHNIKMPGGTKSVWHAFAAIVGRMLGIKGYDATSALHHAMQANETIMRKQSAEGKRSAAGKAASATAARYMTSNFGDPKQALSHVRQDIEKYKNATTGGTAREKRGVNARVQELERVAKHLQKEYKAKDHAINKGRS